VTELKARLQADLNAAMKARDELTTATLRMALTAITTEEVAGTSVRVLTDPEVQRVLTREAKKRREAAEAFAGYLPAQLADAELAELVAAAIVESGASSPRDIGAVMKLVQPRVAGRADGRRVSDEVRRQLAG
jgi:uncharacterized protein YqeY